MKNIVFLSRVTFLYNVCMLVTFGMKYFNIIPEGSLKSTVIVAGFVLSVICNVLTVIWAGSLLVGGTPARMLAPRWVFIFNLLCFIIQIYLLLK